MVESIVMENSLLAKRAQQYLDNTEAEFKRSLARCAAGDAEILVEAIDRWDKHNKVTSHHPIPINASADLIIRKVDGNTTIRELHDGYVLDSETRAWLDDLAYDLPLDVVITGNVRQEGEKRVLVVTSLENMEEARLIRLDGIEYTPSGTGYRPTPPSTITGIPVHVHYTTETHTRSISYEMFLRICQQ
jgi:hypothetical protein